MPNPFRLAVIAKANFDTVRVPVVPVWMQRAALAVGSPIGRLFGYRPTYTPTRTRVATTRRALAAWDRKEPTVHSVVMKIAAAGIARRRRRAEHVDSVRSESRRMHARRAVQAFPGGAVYRT
jgi:hypothetical protein